MRVHLRAYGLLLRWQAGRLVTLLPLLVVVQTLLSAGLILGLGMLLSRDDRAAAGYLATGAPAVALITVGLVMVPMQVSQAKSEGSLELLWSMPVPRLAFLLADLTLWLAIGLPGMALSLLLARLRFGLPVQLTWATVPAVLLVALTATSIGYAVAVLLRPVLAQLTAQVLVFAVLMFSPINYPASRLPAWAAGLHRCLPFEAMGDVVRHAVTPSMFVATWPQYLLLAGYGAVGLALTHRAMNRRG